MSAPLAFIGGFSSFFSVWIFCLFQIIPAVLAYLVGGAMSRGLQGSDAPVARHTAAIILPLAGLVAGFSLIFVGMGLPSTGLGRLVFEYQGVGNQFGGVLSGLIGCYFIGLLTFDISGRHYVWALTLAGLLFGMALGFAYKPCVTPTLTEIYSVSRAAGYAWFGATLLLAYSIGVFAAIGTLAAGLALVADGLTNISLRRIVARVCAIFLLLFSFLILSGNMTVYKSFLVGGFVPGSGS